MRVPLSRTVLLGLALVASPVLAGPKTLDFDVAESKVTNHINGGRLEITTISKIEALNAGEIISESAFFFPAKPEQIVAQLLEPASLCKMSAFCAGVEKTGTTADGKGWTGTMKVEHSKIKDKALKSLWTKDLQALAQKNGAMEYPVTFEVRSEKMGTSTVITFSLLTGKVFQKLDIAVTVHEGGPASTMVTVRSRSHSTLAPAVADRVSLAKRLIRDGAEMLDRALGVN